MDSHGYESVRGTAQKSFKSKELALAVERTTTTSTCVIIPSLLVSCCAGAPLTGAYPVIAREV